MTILLLLLLLNSACSSDYEKKEAPRTAAFYRSYFFILFFVSHGTIFIISTTYAVLFITTCSVEKMYVFSYSPEPVIKTDVPLQLSWNWVLPPVRQTRFSRSTKNRGHQVAYETFHLRNVFMPTRWWVSLVKSPKICIDVINIEINSVSWGLQLGSFTGSWTILLNLLTSVSKNLSLLAEFEFRAHLARLRIICLHCPPSFHAPPVPTQIQFSTFHLYLVNSFVFVFVIIFYWIWPK